jgi:hypothetical protein
MPGKNGRQNFWTLGDLTFTSEAEYLAYVRQGERLAIDVLDQMVTEEAEDSDEPANGPTNGPTNGPKNGHDPVAGDRTRLKTVRVAGVEPQASPQSVPAALGAARTPTTRTEQPPQERFRLFTAAQLNSGRFETRYLIPGVLAAGQSGGIFGASKTLKTSLAADLMISLASGTPFLGRFPVAQPVRVLFLSGQSGLAALQSIARRICAQRGLSLETLGNFVISTDLPRLDRPVDLMALRELIEREKPVCLVIDPAYLAIAEANCRNLFAMGQLLRPLAQLCNSTGCAILLAHHCKRSSKMGLPASLDDVAWSGFVEFSAQWLLLARRRPFDPGTGQHELWLSTGSRAGHHGLWELDVDEGTPEQPDGRHWKTSLRPVVSAEAQADERFVAASEDRRLRRRAVAFEQQRQRVWEVLGAYPDGCNATAVRDPLGINGERMARILQTLVDEGVVTKTEDQIDRRRMKVTYRRRIHPMDLSQAAAEARRTSPRDQKLYDVRSGHFVDPPKLVRANAADPRHVQELGANLGANRSDSTPASRPGEAYMSPQKSGPDTFANGQRTTADHYDFTPTRSDPSRIPAPPSNPARTAPGAGAMPLRNLDELDPEQFLRAMNKPVWWDRRPRNPDGTVQTEADRTESASAASGPSRTPAAQSGPARTAPGAGASPLPGPDTFAAKGTQAERQDFTPTPSSPSRIPAPPSSPAPAAPGAGAWPLQIGVHYLRDGKIERVPPPTFRGGR